MATVMGKKRQGRIYPRTKRLKKWLSDGKGFIGVKFSVNEFSGMDGVLRINAFFLHYFDDLLITGGGSTLEPHLCYFPVFFLKIELTQHRHCLGIVFLCGFFQKEKAFFSSTAVPFPEI